MCEVDIWITTSIEAADPTLLTSNQTSVLELIMVTCMLVGWGTKVMMAKITNLMSVMP